MSSEFFNASAACAVRACKYCNFFCSTSTSTSQQQLPNHVPSSQQQLLVVSMHSCLYKMYNEQGEEARRKKEEQGTNCFRSANRPHKVAFRDVASLLYCVQCQPFILWVTIVRGKQVCTYHHIRLSIRRNIVETHTVESLMT